jgi:hypothetical protein
MIRLAILVFQLFFYQIVFCQGKLVYLADYINEHDSVSTQSLQPALDAAAGHTLIGGPFVIKTASNSLRSKTNFIGKGLRLKGDSAAIGERVVGLLDFDNVANCVMEDIVFDGRNQTPGNPRFWFSFINCYRTQYVTIRNCKAWYGSAAFVRFADQCHHFNIYNNQQWGGDCMVIGNHNRDNGKSGDFYIHHNFRDNLYGKSEAVGIASGYDRRTGQVWYFDSLRIEYNVIINNRASWAMQLSAVRHARIAYNFMYNCKAGITFAPEKEWGAHEGRGEEWYVVPALSSHDTVVYNVIEGFMAEPPARYVASTYGITVIGDSSLVEYNKIRRFNFSGLRTGEFDNIQYSYDPRDRTYVPEKNRSKKVSGTRIAYNVVDSVNNDIYSTVYYGPDYSPFFMNGLENSVVQYNTVSGNDIKHKNVKTKNNGNIIANGNSWQGADNLPVFGAAVYVRIPASTAIIHSKAVDEGPVQYRWTQLAGGRCNLVSPAANTTAISGLKSGWYLFMITATDSAGKKSMNMALVVVEKK